MAEPRRINVGGRQGRGDPPAWRHTDQFAVWRAEDEARDPKNHWFRWFVAVLLYVVLASLLWPQFFGPR